MKNKLAIFDMDGTLFNTDNVNYLAYKDALTQINYELDYEFYCKNCNGRHYKVFLPMIGIVDEHIIEQIHNKKISLYSKYLCEAIENEHLFNIALLMKKEYYLAVVTTASNKNCIEILDYFNRLELFDLLVTQEDIINPKPDPEGFEKAILKFDVLPSDTIIFEDSDVGINAAIKIDATIIRVEKF